MWVKIKAYRTEYHSWEESNDDSKGPVEPEGGSGQHLIWNTYVKPKQGYEADIEEAGIDNGDDHKPGDDAAPYK